MSPIDCIGVAQWFGSPSEGPEGVRDRARRSRCASVVCRLVTVEEYEQANDSNHTQTRTSTSMCWRMREWVLYNSLSVMLITRSFFDKAMY